jgi:hypothetical protein
MQAVTALWHLADIDVRSEHVRLGGKADITKPRSDVR